MLGLGGTHLRVSSVFISPDGLLPPCAAPSVKRRPGVSSRKERAKETGNEGLDAAMSDIGLRASRLLWTAELSLSSPIDPAYFTLDFIPCCLPRLRRLRYRPTSQRVHGPTFLRLDMERVTERLGEVRSWLYR